MNPQLQLMLQQAIQAFEVGNFDGADSILRDVLQNDINTADTIFELGITFANKNSLLEAEIIFRCLQSYKKNDNRIPYNLGFLYAARNDFHSALKSFDEALQISPNDLDTLMNSASALHETGRYQESIAYYNKVLSLNGDAFEAWSNKGNTLNKLKLYDDAISHHDKAISLKPDYHVAWMNKGLVLAELKCYREAITCFDKALSLEPAYAEAALNKSGILVKLKCYEDAASLAERALLVNPHLSEAWVNRGTALLGLKRYEEVIGCYAKALNLNPAINFVYGDLVHTKMKICSWPDLANSLSTISAKVMTNKKVVSPFMLLSLNDDALLHKKSSEIYAQDKYPLSSALGPILKSTRKDEIRIGYISADFRDHPVSYLTAELFELHDQARFEIIAFSFGVDDKSSMRLRLSQAFNQFIDVSDMSDLKIAKLCRDLHIDIAVDLGGFTTNSRTGIFAYRAAPIQVSYIGYLGTMGAEYYDYLLADKTIIPEGSKQFYSEKIAYLLSYQSNDRKRLISDRQFTRQELGLPEKGFVFCCFNNNYKILPDTLSGWMRILKAVEGSVLFLYSENKWAEDNLKIEAEARGIDISRLVFGGRISTEEYLARYKVCDLFLDTFPYNAGTTASDALWTGLPVLTLMGQSFASRVAASLLNAIGLPELITNTQEEYEALAVELAINPQKLADIKLKLANNRLSTPLFNTPLFTKNLEAAYIKMYERYQDDLQPDHISIV